MWLHLKLRETWETNIIWMRSLLYVKLSLKEVKIQGYVTIKKGQLLPLALTVLNCDKLTSVNVSTLLTVMKNAKKLMCNMSEFVHLDYELKF